LLPCDFLWPVFFMCCCHVIVFVLFFNCYSHAIVIVWFLFVAAM
jgi:hypothetical protein